MQARVMQHQLLLVRAFDFPNFEVIPPQAVLMGHTCNHVFHIYVLLTTVSTALPTFKEDLYSPINGECVEPLHGWYDAPILVIESWDDLFPSVERLLGDLLSLDKMQIDLRTWYDEYMRKIVRDFEDLLMQPLEPSL